MARKKENPTPRHATAEEQNVMGLRSAVVEQPVTETLENNYMPYAMSVIVSRAIPEIDGFKPSHRKLLYYDVQDGAAHRRAHQVGEHRRRRRCDCNPHGDLAIYETMVRSRKGLRARCCTPFVDSKGNFGKVYSRDMAYAASRYTEAKLAPICAEIFRDIDKDTVDFVHELRQHHEGADAPADHVPERPRLGEHGHRRRHGVEHLRVQSRRRCARRRSRCMRDPDT